MGTGPLHVPKLPGHPGHRVVPGPLVPHQPLGLRLHGRRSGRRADDEPGRQARRDHRHRRHGRAVRPAPRPGLRRALRVPAHAVVGRRPGQPRRPIPNGSPRSPRRAGSSAGSRTSPPTRPATVADEDLVQDGWTDLSRRMRAHHVAAARPDHARGDDGGVRGLRLREDDGDPRPRRHDRRGPGHRRGPQGLVPPALQAAVLPRRVPAGVQRAGLHLVDTDGKGVERITETRRGGRRRRVRGRLHHLRVGLRGRHPARPVAPATT